MSDPRMKRVQEEVVGGVVNADTGFHVDQLVSDLHT
jgi:hypothetical protein